MLEPNDLPLVCLPLELPAPAAAELVAFLHQLSAAIERHYAGGLHRYYQERNTARRAADTDLSPF
jgi:hypothetical protein